MSNLILGLTVLRRLGFLLASATTIVFSLTAPTNAESFSVADGHTTITNNNGQWIENPAYDGVNHFTFREKKTKQQSNHFVRSKQAYDASASHAEWYGLLVDS
jgi:hypothetical protein